MLPEADPCSVGAKLRPQEETHTVDCPTHQPEADPCSVGAKTRPQEETQRQQEWQEQSVPVSRNAARHSTDGETQSITSSSWQRNPRGVYEAAAPCPAPTKSTQH
ncbi:unnamed protein product [Arctogadus glacialis]